MTTYRPPHELYPFQSHWLDLDGIRLHYLDEGPKDAPPVLMLHGNPTWSFYYRDLVRDLRNRYRCIVPDHIGCGLSDKPADSAYPYRLERRVSDLNALITQLEISQPIRLVVHDWGGMIGLAWATAQATQIARMVLLNTAAFHLPDDKRFPFALWLAGRTRLGALMVRGMNAFSAVAARVAFKRPVSKAVRAGYTGPYNSWANRIATLRFVQDIPLRKGDPGYDIITRTQERLADLRTVPTLLAWGCRDFVFDTTFLRRWQALLPEAEVLRYEKFGHYILEDGGAELRAHIERFLNAPETVEL